MAGAVALLLQANPDLTPLQVQEVLAASARDRQAPGCDIEAGHGLVDVPAALVLAERLQAGEPEAEVLSGFRWSPSLEQCTSPAPPREPVGAARCSDRLLLVLSNHSCHTPCRPTVHGRGLRDGPLLCRRPEVETVLLRRLLLPPVTAVLTVGMTLPALLAPGVVPSASASSASPVPVAPGVVELALPAGPGTTTGPVRETSTFDVLGVTWDAGAPAPAAVAVRTRSGGAWSGWTPLEVESGGPASARPGTAPLWVDGADAVQARVTAAPAGVPAALRVSLVDPGDSPADAAAVRPRLTASAAQVPAIRPRSAWGADESIRGGRPSYASRVQAVTVHHTASSSRYDRDDVPRLLRGFYAYHVKSNRWSDIGYNFLVDRFGTVWEGRAGGMSRAVIGSHAGGFNTGTVGVSMIGTYDSTAPSAAMLEGVAQVAAWKLGTAGVDPRARVRLTSRGSTRYSNGTTVTLPTVFAHRDVSTTECPGVRGYAALPGVRERAAAIVAGAGYLAPEPEPEPLPEVPSAAPEALRVEAPPAVAAGSTVEVVVRGLPGRPVALWFGRPGGGGAVVRRDDVFDATGTYRTSYTADASYALFAASDGETSARVTVAVPGDEAPAAPPVLTVTGPVTVEPHAPALVTVSGPPGVAMSVWFRQHDEEGFRRLRTGVLGADGTWTTTYASDEAHDYFAMSSTITSADATTLVGPVPNGLHVTTPAQAPLGGEVPVRVSGTPGAAVELWFSRAGEPWSLRRRGTVGADGVYRTSWTAAATHALFASSGVRTSTRVTTSVPGAPSSVTGPPPALAVSVPDGVDAGRSAEAVVTGTPGAAVELWFRARTDAVFTKRRSGTFDASGTYRTTWVALEDQEVFATSGGTASRDAAAPVRPVVSGPATGRIGQPVVLTGRARPGDAVTVVGTRAAGGLTTVRTTASSAGTYRVTTTLGDRTTWRASSGDRTGPPSTATTVTPTLTGPGRSGRGSVLRLSGTARPGAVVQVMVRKQGARAFVPARTLVADSRGRYSSTVRLAVSHRWYARADGLSSAVGLTVVR